MSLIDVSRKFTKASRKPPCVQLLAEPATVFGTLTPVTTRFSFRIFSPREIRADKAQGVRQAPFACLTLFAPSVGNLTPPGGMRNEWSEFGCEESRWENALPASRGGGRFHSGGRGYWLSRLERRAFRFCVLMYVATSLGSVVIAEDAGIVGGRAGVVAGLDNGRISLSGVSKMMRSSVDVEVRHICKVQPRNIELSLRVQGNLGCCSFGCSSGLMSLCQCPP